MKESSEASICIIGAGYVGMSLAASIAIHLKVKIWDTNQEKRNLINKKRFTISDSGINDYYDTVKTWQISAPNSLSEALAGVSLIFVCVPTNFDHSQQSFDTSGIEKLLTEFKNLDKNPLIVIKSTIPYGYSKYIYNLMGLNIIFSPEFLREGTALQDQLTPDRVIIGVPDNKIIFTEYLEIIKKITLNNPEILIMTSDEAESVKLFSNSYLAMRVAFFNELDSFSMKYHLNTKQIIEALGFDPRIGDKYNNPSFGFGGYCLPKDTLQLSRSFNQIPSRLINSIIDSNEQRKKLLATHLIELNLDCYGFYRLNMKEKSDNLRESSSIDLLKLLKLSKKNIVIYEPLMNESSYLGFPIVNELDTFKKISNIIIANRYDDSLNDFSDKVFCRDLNSPFYDKYYKNLYN